MKKSFRIIILSTLTGVLTTNVMASEIPKGVTGKSAKVRAVSNAYSKVGQSLIEYLKKIDGMQWVKGGISGSEGYKPLYNITAFFVPYETNQNITFIQTRMAFTNKNKTLNLGLGYRKLVGDNIFGVNVFYDLSSDAQYNTLFSNNHKRASLGLEFKTPIISTYAYIQRFKRFYRWTYAITGCVQKNQSDGWV